MKRKQKSTPNASSDTITVKLIKKDELPEDAKVLSPDLEVWGTTKHKVVFDKQTGKTLTIETVDEQEEQGE